MATDGEHYNVNPAKPTEIGLLGSPESWEALNNLFAFKEKIEEREGLYWYTLECYHCDGQGWVATFGGKFVSFVLLFLEIEHMFIDV